MLRLKKMTTIANLKTVDCMLQTVFFCFMFINGNEKQEHCFVI